MTELLADLKRRKLVQWALAYLAAAWAVLQALGLAADSYGRPRHMMQIPFAAAALDFAITLLLGLVSRGAWHRPDTTQAN